MRRRSQTRRRTVSAIRCSDRVVRHDGSRDVEDGSALDIVVHIPGRDVSLHNGGDGSATSIPRRLLMSRSSLRFCIRDGASLDAGGKVANVLGSPNFQHAPYRVAPRNSVTRYSAQNFGRTCRLQARTGHYAPHFHSYGLSHPGDSSARRARLPCWLQGFPQGSRADERLLVSDRLNQVNQRPAYPIDHAADRTDLQHVLIPAQLEQLLHSWLPWSPRALSTKWQPADSDLHLRSLDRPEHFFCGNSGCASAEHEISEWMNDPFIHNFVPPWQFPGVPGSCQGNLETGDPVEVLANPDFPVDD